MARIPIEIIRIGKEYHNEIDLALNFCNSLQSEFLYSYLKPEEEKRFSTLNFAKGKIQELIPILSERRKELKGFHPFTIFVVDSELEDEEYTNLFGGGEPNEGLFIFTWNNVPEIIIPKDKMESYFLFFFARYALNSILPEHYNHYDTRGCVFDFNELKSDLSKSMISGAMCDECRMEMLSNNYSMNEGQFNALNILFEQAGTILNTQKENIYWFIIRRFRDCKNNTS